MSFWTELRRRNVFRVGAVYLATAWVLSQVASLVSQAFDAPTWPLRAVLVVFAVGFPFALVAAWVFELTPEGLKRTSEVAPAASIRHETGRRLDRVLIGVIGLLIVVLLLDRWVFPAHEGLSAPARAARPAAGDHASAAPGARLEHSVAVLPLENLSPNPSDAYFAAGIHEEILNYLARLKSVNVIARTSVARYAKTDESIEQIGEELNVETVMEGSVRYADNRVRVTTQLIDARNGAHLWSDAYERDFKDIFAIQADIAMSVANALNAAFSPEEQRQVERAPTSSPEAYTLYLQYLDLAARGNQGPQLLALADQMIARDPKFAFPFGLKADTYSNLLVNTTFGSASDRAQTEASARSNAQHAFALDATDLMASGALANVDLFEWHWTRARQTYESYYASTGRPAGYFRWFLSYAGQHAKAIEVAQHEVAHDPNNWAAHWNAGLVFLYAGDKDAAVSELRRGIELAPALSLERSWLAWAEIARGNYDEAKRQLQFAETLLGNERTIINLVEILYSYGRIGRSDDVERLFAEIETRAKKEEIGAGGWAAAYLAVGDQAKALEQLRVGAQRAHDHVLDPSFFTLMNIRMNVTRDPVLEQPDFAAARAALEGD